MSDVGMRNAECGVRSGAQVVDLQGVGSADARRGLVNRSYGSHGSHGTHGTYLLGLGCAGMGWVCDGASWRGRRKLFLKNHRNR